MILWNESNLKSNPPPPPRSDKNPLNDIFSCYGQKLSMPTLATESHVEMSVNFRQHFLTRVADPGVWSDPDFGEEKNRVRILIRFFLDGRIRVFFLLEGRIRLFLLVRDRIRVTSGRSRNTFSHTIIVSELPRKNNSIC